MTESIRGLPYPTGTDRVVDGDNAIRALAEAIDERPYFVADGQTTVGTSTTQMNLVIVEDPFGMVNNPQNQVVIPAGFGGLWYFQARLTQSGINAMTGNLRDVATNTSVLIDSRTGASGAAAAPMVSGIIRVTAGQAFDMRGTVSTGTVGVRLIYPHFTGYFLRA